MNEKSIKIEISSLEEYWQEIKGIKETLEESREFKRFFFRGQKNSDWAPTPSIFRDNNLSIEHKRLKEAVRREPENFLHSDSHFKTLTTLQHYGVATRLLDVTTNPLVALYFACEAHAEERREGTREGKEMVSKSDTSGTVFLKNTEAYDESEIYVQVASCIPFLDIKSGLKVKDLLDKIQQISPGKFINLLNSEIDTILLDRYFQSNYYVLPKLSNQRLKAQSGAFIITAGLTFLPSGKESPLSFEVKKTNVNLSQEFDYQFTIPCECKSSILEELDLFGINNATLFPEFEHQMHYVQNSHLFEKLKKPSEDLIPINEAISIYRSQPTPNDEVNDKPIEIDSDSGEKLGLTDKELVFYNVLVRPAAIQDLYKPEELKEMTNRLIEELEESLTIDWQQRQSTRAGMRRMIKRLLDEYDYPTENQDKAIQTIIKQCEYLTN